MQLGVTVTRKHLHVPSSQVRNVCMCVSLGLLEGEADRNSEAERKLVGY